MALDLADVVLRRLGPVPRAIREPRCWAVAPSSRRRSSAGAPPRRSGRAGAGRGVRASAPGPDRRHVALLDVPADRALDAFPGCRPAAHTLQQPPCLRDVELAVVGEEADAPAMDRWVDAERDAGHLAGPADGEERPDGQVDRRHLDADDAGGGRRDLVQRRRRRPGDDEHWPRASGRVPQSTRPSTMSSTCTMCRRCARADHHETALGST